MDTPSHLNDSLEEDTDQDFVFPGSSFHSESGDGRLGLTPAMSSALRIAGTVDQANASDEELKVAFEIGRANSLSPSRETFCESHWSGDESERDDLDEDHEDELGSTGVVRNGTAHRSGQKPSDSSSYPRVNGFTRQTQSLGPECAADEVTSSRKASNGEVGRCRGGRGVTVGNNAVMPGGLSSGTQGCSVLPDEGKLADGVDGREEPEVPRKQTPPPSSATPSLRRSSRIAAANARVTAVSTAGGGSTTAGGGNSVSRVRNITAGLRSGKKGAESSEGLDSTLTPFGTRRALRAANQESTKAQRATPVGISKAEALDDANTSFRTAIMGDLTPGGGENLDDNGDTRRGALFGDDDPTHDGKLMVRSEALTTAMANAEFDLSEGKEDVDDTFSESRHLSLDGNSESAHDVEMLGDQLSRLTCGVHAEESKNDIEGRPEIAELCEESRLAEEDFATNELFSASLNTSVHDVSFNGGMKYPPLSPAEEESSSPSAAAVSLPLRVLLGATESCQDDSDHASEKGVVPTTSTLGASSFDGSDEGPKNFSELSPPGAEAGVTTGVARFEQSAGVVAEPEAAAAAAAAAAPVKDLPKADCGHVDQYVAAMMGSSTASRSLTNVELEGRKLAAALISEEESRKHLLPKVVSTLDGNVVPEMLNAKEAGAGDGDAETPGVEVYSPPEGDGPSRNAKTKTANEVGKAREATPPEVAGERPRPNASQLRAGSRGHPSSGPGVAPKRANPSRSPARRDPAAGASAAKTATVSGMISTVAARRASRVAPGRMTGNGPVIARRQSMAFVPPTLSTNSSGSGALGGASQQASVSSTGRGRLLRRSNSSGVNGAVSRPVGSGREPAKASGTATQPQAAAPVVTPVPVTSHLLAPTAASQSRARARSVSPSVSSARGRASVNGTPSVLPEERPGSGSIAPRRTPSASGTSTQSQTQIKGSLQKPRASSTGRRALTTPETPLFRTSQRSKVTKATESTEDLEVRKQREMQDQLKEMTRRNQVTMERSRRVTHGANIRSSKTLTVPESPAMQTSGRLGGKVYSAAGAQAGSGSRENSMTFREAMSRIENKTPERFRTRPAREQHQHQSKTTAAAAVTDTKPTLPAAPKLRTEARAAGHARVMSREEREEAELEEMRKHQFKARPYRSGGYGVGGENGVFKTRQSDKPPTQPEPFNLRTEDRAARRAPSPIRNRDDEEVLKQFKARPMPGTRSSSVGRVRPGANVTTRPGRLPQQQQQPLTVAESPNLMTKRRSAIRASVAGGAQVEAQAQAQEKVRLQSAAAVPDRHAGPTEPRPFNLRSEERGRAKQALLAQRLEAQRKQEEAATRVRARPMPSQSIVFVPAPSNRPLTETSEFNLPGQARHERATNEFRERVRLEEEQARRAAEVKALPIPLATYEPETVRPRSDLSPTQPLDVKLHTTTRAEGRAQWDHQNEARLAAEERERVEQASAAAEAEKYAIAEMRRKSQAEGGMTFKAAPITWNRSPVKCAQLSSAPLTTPITPNLQTKRRAIQAGVREKVPPAV